MGVPFRADPLLAATRYVDVTAVAVHVPAELHPESKRLVQAFAEAIAVKLRAAEQKHGYGDHWLHDLWEDGCRRELLHHLEKGDPLDVAIYGGFMWARGWRTKDGP